METVICRLTVFFEAPFWVGVYERASGGRLEAARIVFGDEPKDYEIYELMAARWSSLVFSPPVPKDMSEDRRASPKRMQREVHRILSEQGTGTKAQQALKLQHEQNKLERREKAHNRTEEEKERQFDLKQQKRKEKHRGR